MNWLLTAILCVLLVELAVRLPLAGAVLGVSGASKRAARVLRAKAISDHWKEKAMGAYARATFASTLKLAGLLIVILAIAFALVLLFEQISSGFESFILGWWGIGFSLVFATLYFSLRKVLLRAFV
ncbi:hypothetical protein HDIA_3308 [Hartmannibacter diazotrophicus]|uniref:Uncharacterized protein n=1 Tax=Hartmannibacter diazotrophicus TaxID=1482074 RepID=A0A2C9D9I1_9HYPH|nr:hypothetical protein [Hartmannibacter diazotrophicus]SON56849.1 hypothetical protein HDIA_3308 [Hartmannibacter diazotrophicus]